LSDVHLTEGVAAPLRASAGPWRSVAKLSGSENHKGYIVRAAGGWAVADVWPLDEDGTEGGANASLIAAAPDLLAALTQVANTAQVPSVIRDVARAAISKATGTA
jgi:hypothetical protein